MSPGSPSIDIPDKTVIDDVVTKTRPSRLAGHPGHGLHHGLASIPLLGGRLGHLLDFLDPGNSRGHPDNLVPVSRGCRVRLCSPLSVSALFKPSPATPGRSASSSQVAWHMEPLSRASRSQTRPSLDYGMEGSHRFLLQDMTLGFHKKFPRIKSVLDSSLRVAAEKSNENNKEK